MLGLIFFIGRTLAVDLVLYKFRELQLCLESLRTITRHSSVVMSDRFEGLLHLSGQNLPGCKSAHLPTLPRRVKLSLFRLGIVVTSSSQREQFLIRIPCWAKTQVKASYIVLKA